MLGASRHDRQCESDDDGAGQPAARATEGLPNLIPASRQNWWCTSERILFGVLGCRLSSDRDAPRFEVPRLSLHPVFVVTDSVGGGGTYHLSEDIIRLLV